MPITVCRVDNLFWDNNSYKKPNCAPTFVEAKELNQKPVIYGFMGGRTHLYGDQWNYAIYKGVYYFLKIDGCKDLEKQHYTYVMIRDMWVNMILNHNIEVRGFLTTTNRDGWIEANLNRAHPVLTQPCNVTRLSLVEGEQTLGDAAYMESTKILPLPLFDIREFREFKEKWNVAAKKYKKQLELEKYRAGNSPIFIFAELKGKQVETIHSWKEYLRIKLNEFLRDLGNEGLVISKVQNTDGAGRLKEHYCITWNQGGIGSGVENVVIDLVDLGNLEDIVHIDPRTLEEGAPMKVIDERIFEDIEFFYRPKVREFEGELLVKKFRRKIYFPITQDPGRAKIALAPHYSYQGYEDNPLLRDRVNWHWLNPQHVKLKETGLRELFLFWVDNADFVLNYDPKITWRSELPKVAGTMGGVTIVGDTEHWDFTSTDYRGYLKYMFGITKYPEGFKVPYPFYATWGDKYGDWFFNHQKITPIGFLIFKPFNKDYLDGYIWKGNNTNRIHYISGLRRTRLEMIENGEAFSKIGNMNDLPYLIRDYYSFSGQPTAYNWNRYHFNLLNGLDILLQPNQKGYTYEYRTWRPNDKTSNNYSLRYLQHDKAPWLNKRAPFYSRERHEESNRRSRTLVDWVAMKTLIEIPLELTSGDYLFNDLEYWLDEHGTELWTDAVSYARVNPLSAQTDPILEKLFAIEDYVKEPKPIEDSETNSVVICSTREGNLEIRQCFTFSKIHRLHSDIYSQNLADIRTDIDSLEGFGGSRESKLDTLGYSTDDLVEREQAVESVSGQTSRRVGYIALKQMPRGQIEKVEDPLRPEQIKEILAAFLKSNGYKLSPDNQSVLYFHRKDFDEAVDLFFDLKGTDWYLHVKSGRLSLIAKKPELFRGKDLKVSKLKTDEALKGLSVVEKVNQKCVLNVYTHQRLLNTRFNFDNDKLNVSVAAIKPSHKKNPTNYYQINLRGDYDVIERDIITVQKKELDETATIVDYTQLEALRVQMRRNDRDYDIRMAKDIMFATEKENEEYRRKKWDLDAEKMRYWLSQGANIATLGLTSLGLPGLPGQIGQVIQAINPLQGAAKTMKKKATALSFIRGAKTLTSTIGDPILQTQMLEERGRRIETDRKFAFKDIAFRSLDIDLKHRDKQEDTIRELNKLGNIYNRGTINDIDIIEEFNKENKLGAVNLTVFTPSREQLKVLNELKEEYGIDCDIPNVVIELREGMSGDVIRFRHLEDEGVIGLDNAVERGWLIAALEMGIKVVEVCGIMRTRARKLKELFSCANVYQLTQEIQNQRIISESSGKIEKELRGEITILKDQISSKESDIGNKQHLIDQLNAKVANDKAELDKLAETIAQKESELQKLTEECEKEKKELREQNEGHENDKKALKEKEAQLAEEIRKHKVDYEDLTQQLNNERIKVLNLTDRVNLLTHAGDMVNNQFKEAAERADNLQKRVSDLEKQLADEKAKKPNGKKPQAPQEDCELLHSIINYPYEYELKARENGWSAFMDLVFELANAMKWKDVSEMDQKLLNVAEVRPMLEKLEELKNIPIIDRAMDAIKARGWQAYLKWLEVDGQASDEVREVIQKMNQIKLMETMPTVHSVKALLDELNWLSYKAKYALSEQLKTNEDLQTLFAHIYPGKSLDLYRALFGDPNTAIIKKRYIEKNKCIPGGGGSVVQTLINYKKNVSYSVSDIPTKPVPETPEAKPATPEEPSAGEKLTTSSLYPIYYGEPIYTGSKFPEGQRVSIFGYSALSFFEDAYKSQTWSVDSIAAGSNYFRGNPGFLAISFWKYPYDRTTTTGKRFQKLVWFYKRWSDSLGNPQNQYGHYIEATYTNGILGMFKSVWRKIEDVKIPEEMLEGLKNGTRKIQLRFKNLESDTYEIRSYTETLDLGRGKIEIPEKDLEGLVKFIFILHYYHVQPYDAGKADNYRVYGLRGGFITDEYFAEGYWKNTNANYWIDRINQAIASIRDQTIDLQLGWLINRSPNGDRVNSKGKSVVHEKFYSYFYWTKTQNKFVHPWELDGGAMWEMLRGLNSVKRS